MNRKVCGNEIGGNKSNYQGPAVNAMATTINQCSKDWLSRVQILSLTRCSFSVCGTCFRGRFLCLDKVDLVAGSALKKSISYPLIPFYVRHLWTFATLFTWINQRLTTLSYHYHIFKKMVGNKVRHCVFEKIRS